MKRWSVVALAAILCLGGLPFSGTDVGELQPLEVFYVYQEGQQICIDTDTGDQGRGADLEAALADLRAGASGEIFLDTADYLLLGSGGWEQLPGLWQQLRPGCRVCRVSGEPDLEAAAAFLRTHAPEVTLLRLQAGEKGVPILRIKEGEMRLVEP